MLVTELRRIPGYLGGAKGILLWLAALIGLGYVLPEVLGSAFFDIQLLVTFAVFSVIFVSPVVCESVCADASRRLPRSYLHGKLLAGILFGVFSSLALIAIRIVAVNRGVDAPRLLVPPTHVLLSLLAISLAAACFGATASAWVSVLMGHAKTARQIIRTGFLLFLVVLMIASRYAPPLWRNLLLNQLTMEEFPLFAGKIGILCLALSWLLLRKVSRDPRYSHSRYSEESSNA